MATIASRRRKDGSLGYTAKSASNDRLGRPAICGDCNPREEGAHEQVEQISPWRSVSASFTWRWSITAGPHRCGRPGESIAPKIAACYKVRLGW